MANKKISSGLKRAQTRLMKMNSRKILNNVVLLYIILFATIADLLYMVTAGSHINVIVFILVAYVTSLFSKNMTVILLVALALTNMYDLGKKIVLKEGFEEGNEEDKTEDKETGDDKEDKETGDDKEDEETGDDKTENEETSPLAEKVPEEFKEALKRMSDPETRKTIESLKELEPMVNKVQDVIKMLK